MQRASTKAQYKLATIASQPAGSSATLKKRRELQRSVFPQHRLSLIRQESLVFRNQLHTLGEHRLNLAVGPENGPPLVLLHGVLRCWNDWSPMLDALAARWKVIGVDFRGHGRSDRTPGAYRVADYIRDTVRLFEQLAADQFAGEPAVVLGHSLGAMVALGVGADAPDAVRAVIAEDPPFHTMGDRIAQTPLLEYFQGLRQLCRRNDFSLAELTRNLAELPIRSPDGSTLQRLGDLRDAASLRLTAACLKQVDPNVLEPIVAGDWFRGYDVASVLAHVRCPVLLLQADAAAGGMLTDVDAALAEQTLNECYRERFSGVGHLIHWTDTPGMTRRTLAFLESLRTGERVATAAADSEDSHSGRAYRIDGHETRPRHDSHQKRPVG